MSLVPVWWLHSEDISPSSLLLVKFAVLLQALLASLPMLPLLQTLLLVNLLKLPVLPLVNFGLVLPEVWGCKVDWESWKQYFYYFSSSNTAWFLTRPFFKSPFCTGDSCWSSWWWSLEPFSVTMVGAGGWLGVRKRSSVVSWIQICHWVIIIFVMFLIDF